MMNNFHLSVYNSYRTNTLPTKKKNDLKHIDGDIKDLEDKKISKFQPVII